MSPITTSAEVNRPADEVFAYATDPTRFAEWQHGVIDGRMADPAAPTAGARCVTTRRIGRANRASTSELTHIEPPRAWGVRGIDGPIRAVVEVTVEPLAPARSRLTITVDFQGHGVGKLLVPLLVRREARKEMPVNIATLKRRLET
ncbi:MAG TPA: SRPBCC family protein [Actinocrinis sp.]|jgi:uncharacterized protein YndB with AHSA1/START domain|uniref:SRPBCC family protein n=1 Tax=Actinocrinis sp. TaxID=1920516 RepID=UPI002DDCB849|nr:SRPBCC family protein [Actinocrinis sp.]HEV3172643.1 SRPBCC family protein [Actinocrinis sp.]